jgi:hypothetical protein
MELLPGYWHIFYTVHDLCLQAISTESLPLPQHPHEAVQPQDLASSRTELPTGVGLAAAAAKVLWLEVQARHTAPEGLLHAVARDDAASVQVQLRANVEDIAPDQAPRTPETIIAVAKDRIVDFRDHSVRLHEDVAHCKEVHRAWGMSHGTPPVAADRYEAIAVRCGAGSPGREHVGLLTRASRQQYRTALTKTARETLTHLKMSHATPNLSAARECRCKSCS